MITLSIIVLFILSIISQIIYWRLFMPKNTGKTLVFTLTTANIFFIIVIKIFFKDLFFSNENISFILFCLLCIDLMYVFAFPPLEYPSPSIELISMINKNKSLSMDTFIKNKLKENVIEEKIEQLVNEKYIIKDKNELYLTPKGKTLIFFFKFYKKLINQGKGG